MRYGFFFLTTHKNLFLGTHGWTQVSYLCVYDEVLGTVFTQNEYMLGVEGGHTGLPTIIPFASFQIL